MARSLACLLLLVGACTSDALSPDAAAAGDMTAPPPQCLDGSQDGDETDVDCGGSCVPCGTGKRCVHGSDCRSRICTNAACAAPSCSDGYLNGDETDVDCGGSCTACGDGKMCFVAHDCLTRLCTNNICRGGSDMGLPPAVDMPPMSFDQGGGGPSTFAAPAVWATMKYPYAIAAADLDHDGHSDVAVADESGFLEVLYGTGSGAVGSIQSRAVGMQPDAVAVGDLDGDGWSDVVVGDTNINSLYVFLNRRQMGNVLNAAITYATPHPPNQLALADLDGDGHLDVAAGNYHEDVLLNDGSGGLKPGIDNGGGGRFALADLNLDGKLDFAMDNGNAVNVLLNQGSGMFSGNNVFYGTTNGIVDIVAADMNRDGKPDVVAAIFGGLNVLLGNGDGTLANEINYGGASAPQGTIATGDINGDGWPDLVMATQSSTVAVSLNDGKGGFLAPLTLVTEQAQAVALADMNGDGKLDILLADTNAGDVAILLNTSQ